MKKSYLTLIALVFLSLTSFSQKPFETYTMEYLKDGKEYTIDIAIDTTKKDDFSLYTDMYSTDASTKSLGIIITNKNYESFIEALNAAKAKYIEWTKVAKENNVKELRKEIEVNAKNIKGYFLYGSKWKFDYSISLSFTFSVISLESGLKYVLIVGTGKMTASDNQFMETDSGLIVFSNVNEIDDFLSKITLDKINEFKTKPKKEDLFK
ncbi:MAG: hypothetical protein CVU00_09285 [Bacteroidetes bacterium HGW-Bacteroidetes-17]|jgi:PBP1b-binding outer membrane lipoprotein LpoB|nr:MAG: hypothetical protein CVU00_09285 [Bacteroidetes bacterium HGW-Bacteroidetes-17]